MLPASTGEVEFAANARSPLLAADAVPAAANASRGSNSIPTAAVSARARRRLRRCAAAVLSQLKAERNNEDPGQPDLQAAAEYMRYFLPKTEDGKLLPLGCSEAEFAQHRGGQCAGRNV